MAIDHLEKHQVLVKGPCDLFQIYPYIANTELFDTEFTYTDDRGVTIESTGHTTHIVEAHRLTAAQKAQVLKEVPFSDMGMYRDDIYTKPYKVIFISILTDANLGVYRRKETGERLAFLEYIHPITDPKNWDGLIKGTYSHAGFAFSVENLKAFSANYEFIGRNTPEQVVENLRYIREHIHKEAVLVIMLGGELAYEKNTFPAYADRHLVHKAMNKEIRKWAADKDNVKLLDVNKYLKDQTSFYDHFNHYTKPVYYHLAQEMAGIINACTENTVRNRSKLMMAVVRGKEILAPCYHRLRRTFLHGK